MGERFFVRLTTAWRAMPREENGKAPASGPLSSAKARRRTKYKLDFTKTTVAWSENGNKEGPTHEICRLVSEPIGHKPSRLVAPVSGNLR